MTHEVFKIINKKHPNLSWVQDRTIFLTLHGSRAYGTNVEGSDEDFKGVAIPPKEMFFSSYKTFEQVILDKKEDPDTVIFDIRKFLKLAAGANPNLIEVLFTDPSDHVLVTPLGQKLLDNKEIFLSKKIRATFVGYAISQMKKMKSHRGYLLNPPDHKPTREEFGLQEKPEIDKEQMSAAFAEIKKEMDRAQFNFMDHLEEAVKIQLREAMEEMLSNMKLGADDQWLGVARSIGFDDNFIELMQKERRFLAAKREFASFEEWKRTRNEKRFKDEKEFGMNLKHAYHLVRLTRMAEEMLSTGKVIVKRPDREELLFIRNGGWTYDQIMHHMQKQNAKIDQLFINSSILPDQCDVEKVDKLGIELIEQSFQTSSHQGTCTW